MKSTLPKLLCVALVVSAVSLPTLAQGVMAGAGPAGPPGAAAGTIGAAFDPTVFGTVMVYLRTEDGQPLPRHVTPVIRIRSTAGGVPMENQPVPTGDGWLFSGISIGNDYEVLVSATGYTVGHETVRMPNTRGAAASVIVFMHPVDQELVFHRPEGQFILAPRAAKEIQHSLEDLQAGKVESARKHAQKAIQWAPDNPYVQYVMGLTYLLTNNFKESKPYLEKSVSTDPHQAAALEALGTARYQLGDNAGAAEVLSKAVQMDTNSWRSEWTLAAAYLGEKRYQEARDHSEQALKVGKKDAGHARAILAQALAGLGEREEAAQEFEMFAEQYPEDSNIKAVQDWIKLLREPAKPGLPVDMSQSFPVGANMALSSMPAVEIPPKPDWAPPDVDLSKPFVVSTATCPLEQILTTAGANAEQMISNLQQFTATEDFQRVETNKKGELQKPAQDSFGYLVVIERVTPSVFDVKEIRSQGTSETQLPGLLQQDGNATAMALVFHPEVQHTLDWKCEGLGTWNDQPAWVIHFVQKPDQPSVLATFDTPKGAHSLPLKGRAWVSQKGGEVLHLDTDLVKAITPIDLRREHFSIDYKQVSFHAHNVDLWLPENVDTYYQYEGHFLHYYHHFSNFKLFWVGASQKIGDPKEANKDPNQPDKDQ